MTKLINPESLPTAATYTHVIVANGSKTVFVAGQEPEDAQGNLVGRGDLAAQAQQVFATLAAHSPLPVPPARSRRSPSTWFITDRSICQ